jgi:pantoate--beta-alanine ligase
MGALHAGHGKLIEHGIATARDRGLPAGCIVSVFVNPTQFDDAGDFARYPATLDADTALAEAAGAACVFAPSVGVMYPGSAAAHTVDVPPPGVGRGLEDAHRPGHFAGVCQVVRRLFDLVMPAAAIFGEKDWQQFVVVRAMARRDALPVDIINAPTVREPDGVAMSSRNRFLSPDDRNRARALIAALRASADETSPDAAEHVMAETLHRHGVDAVDYAAVRDAETLGPADQASGRPMRAIITARVGSVRLLDNAPWPAGPGRASD